MTGSDRRNALPEQQSGRCAFCLWVSRELACRSYDPFYPRHWTAAQQAWLHLMRSSSLAQSVNVVDPQIPLRVPYQRIRDRLLRTEAHVRVHITVQRADKVFPEWGSEREYARLACRSTRMRCATVVSPRTGRYSTEPASSQQHAMTMVRSPRNRSNSSTFRKRAPRLPRRRCGRVPAEVRSRRADYLLFLETPTKACLWARMRSALERLVSSKFRGSFVVSDLSRTSPILGHKQLAVDAGVHPNRDSPGIPGSDRGLRAK